ncbi:class I SAM-dependent methyltransferase [Geitlerinema sp. P-1104]|uniref:class I SAM-dependent methyltransferase n=1 Tax=Geitlerinema sp. P-1104 TaxID=2546230 RepID=UPI0014773FC8|nr:class I SAM-dependent methyltransferase [Geitlerinema sp. P-1104]NMG57633.1 class I SAM-dependent methyltransferase [Geitlerinema sp. P-1104]
MGILKDRDRSKLDSSDDARFYEMPRFVTHVDESFIDQLTQLYRDRLQANSHILDLMSSWVSHLPEDIPFTHVEGHGMNEAELAKNPQLDHYIVQNLNHNSKLPYGDEQFDAVLNAVSVQYLQHPEEVFAEMHRILKPGGLAIVSFSNRMFYQKAIQAWREGSEASRVQLVKRYFQAVPGFAAPEVIAKTSDVPSILQMMGFAGADPFYAVIGEKTLVKSA